MRNRKLLCRFQDVQGQLRSIAAPCAGHLVQRQRLRLMETWCKAVHLGASRNKWGIRDRMMDKGKPGAALGWM
jgi:hypothetical protein